MSKINTNELVELLAKGHTYLTEGNIKGLYNLVKKKGLYDALSDLPLYVKAKGDTFIKDMERVMASGFDAENMNLLNKHLEEFAKFRKGRKIKKYLTYGGVGLGGAAAGAGGTYLYMRHRNKRRQ